MPVDKESVFFERFGNGASPSVSPTSPCSVLPNRSGEGTQLASPPCARISHIYPQYTWISKSVPQQSCPGKPLEEIHAIMWSLSYRGTSVARFLPVRYCGIGRRHMDVPHLFTITSTEIIHTHIYGLLKTLLLLL